MNADELLRSLSQDRDKDDENGRVVKKWSMDEIDELLGIGHDDALQGADDAQDEYTPDTENDDDTEDELTANEAEEISRASFKAYESEVSDESESTVSEPEDPGNAESETFSEISYENESAKNGETDIPEKIASDDSAGVDDKTKVFSPPASTVVMKLADDTQADVKPDIDKKAMAQKTVGIRPVRNEDIEHQILTERFENSGVDPDRIRSRFFNAPHQKLERTSEFEKAHPNASDEPQERPGIIIKKSKFTNTADLEPIPTLISAEDQAEQDSKNETAGPVEKDTVAGQIRLTGFEEEPPAQQIDEDSAEQELAKTRTERIKEFVLSSPEIEDEELKEEQNAPAAAVYDSPLGIEYEKPADKKAVEEKINRSIKLTFIGACVQSVLFCASLVINILIDSAGGGLDTIGGSAGVCLMINILLLLASACFSLPCIKHGAHGIKELRLNADSGTLMIAVACLIQLIVTFLSVKDSYISAALYAPVSMFAFAASSFSRLVVLKRIRGNFTFLTNGTQLYSTERVGNEDDAFEIGRGLMIDEPDICYSARTDFPADFISMSFENDPADRIAKDSLPVIALAAVVAAIAGGVISKDIIIASAFFAGVCSIAVPSFLLFSSDIPLLAAAKKLNVSGACVSGYEAVKSGTYPNAVVLDSTDLFRNGSCTILGIKTFHNMRIDDAILYTAAMEIRSGGPVGDIFSEVILGKNDLLPDVESLAYEDKLGLSAWINGRRILAGSRELLNNHSILTPDETFEAKYTHDGRKVIYLAVAGKIAAMFVLEYKGDEHVTKSLRGIQNSGLTLLVRSSDPNITEELICSYFDVPMSSVKILSPVSGDIYKKYRDTSLGTARAGLIHNGTLESFIGSLLMSRSLSENIHVNKIVAIIYMIMTAVVFALISVLSGVQHIGSLQIILFQVIWGAVATLISLLSSKLS